MNFSLSSDLDQLYIPRSIQKAYKAQTRDKSGKPGKNYWQNHGDYHLVISVDPETRMVRGTEEIIYTNNSPDTLKKLNFKLIVNHHKPNIPRNAAMTEDYLSSGIHVDRFLEDGELSSWENEEKDGTDKFIELKNPLKPGDRVNFVIDWHYWLSKDSAREGAISENTFFLAYFYPRVAVYDDYEGWDTMPHTLSNEFYNNFNNYTFEVQVPKNYLVWATGILQNPEEVLQPSFVDLVEESMNSEQVINVVTEEDLQDGNITKDHATLCWKWEAENVPDIAIGISNEYLWDAGSVQIGEKRVSVQAAYDSTSDDFKEVVDWSKQHIQWLSENLPGVPFPYPKMTVFQGFLDMEYPMMALDMSNGDDFFTTRSVVGHEIFHSYFPFMMGTNETRYAFMDEGWAVTIQYLMDLAFQDAEKADAEYKDFRISKWMGSKDFENDLPIIIPSNLLTGTIRRNNAYGKTSLALLGLIDMLGEKRFKKALHGYMERWKGKHPMPWDFFFSFNDVLNENLNWYWNRWFFSTNYIDYEIESVKLNPGNTSVRIKNTGGFPTPLDLVLTYEDGGTKTIHQTPAIWKKNKQHVEIRIPGKEHPHKIHLETGLFLMDSLEKTSWEKDVGS